MGPAPQLSTYQQAASSIYEPQKQAEQTQIQANQQTTKNTLESEKGQIGTDYQSAIDKLTQSVQGESAKINQLYNQRLGGNFSGLQANDFGGLFARTNEAQSIIEQTRANKLASITTAEGNADITANAQIAALTPKYQSLEADYANKAYGSAVKDYNTNAYRQETLQLREQSEANTNAYRQAELGLRAKAAGNKTAAQYKATGKLNSIGKADTSQGYMFTGPNGKPINMAEYIKGAGMGGQDIVDLLSNGSQYDQNVAKAVQQANPQNDQQLIAAIKKADKGNFYGF